MKTTKYLRAIERLKSIFRMRIIRMIEMDGFYRVGECTRCGACCNLKDTINDPEIMLWVDAGILKQVNQELVDGKTGRCRHLKYEDGKAHCEIYETRPEVCRRFPEIPRDLLSVPQCGYRFYMGGRRVLI